MSLYLKRLLKEQTQKQLNEHLNGKTDNPVSSIALANTLSEDELLAIAGKTPVNQPGVDASGSDEDKELNDIERFVIAHGIKSGTTRIPASLVWFTYKNWSKDPVSKRTFFIAFYRMFEAYRDGSERFYLLDPTPFDLSIDTYLKARAEVRERKMATRMRNKDEKKKNKVTTQAKDNELENE